MSTTIRFTLNGHPKQVTADRERMLLWVLRTDFELTGAKYGCGEGYCGSCTVLVDNEAIRSCQTPLEDVNGKEVLTIEGLADGPELSPIQESFVDHGAVQCGFCSPGMILSAKALLDENPFPNDEEIKQAITGNFCRCTGYDKVVRAVLDAVAEMEATV